MGCLKNIIKIIIIVLALIGLSTILGGNILKGDFSFKLFHAPSQEKLKEKAAPVADLSQINEEYKINKTANIVGMKAVVAEHKASSQKMIIADTGKKELLTRKDFETKEVDKKLQEMAQKIQYQFVRLENIKVTQRGTMQTMGQTAPYVRFKADTVNLPMAEVQGVIGVISDKDNHSKIILSVGDSDKYSQIITQQFFKDVK